MNQFEGQILPPRNGLLQHIKRACYQRGWVWRTSVLDGGLPNPEYWGWIKLDSDNVRPKWQDIEDEIINVHNLVIK